MQRKKGQVFCAQSVAGSLVTGRACSCSETSCGKSVKCNRKHWSTNRWWKRLWDFLDSCRLFHVWRWPLSHLMACDVIQCCNCHFDVWQFTVKIHKRSAPDASRLISKVYVASSSHWKLWKYQRSICVAHQFSDLLILKLIILFYADSEMFPSNFFGIKFEIFQSIQTNCTVKL